uniref:Putative LOV domain-containing protein n=1 Tax=Botryococcus terribilis TaxID=1471368 RepID=A0A126X148_9CHLO|nr:putative LOV domain-containing protein [Botryococcus terribilis]
MRHGKLVCICPVKALDSSLHRASRSDSLQAALASVKIPESRIAALPGGGCVVGSDAGLVSSGHVVVAFSGKLENHAVLSQEYGAAPVLEGDVPKHETKVADLLGRMYLALGREVLPLLRGDYTYIIYDSNQVRVLAVRSCSSTQPLLQGYTADGSLVVTTANIDDPTTLGHLAGPLEQLQDIPQSNFKYGWRADPKRFATPPSAPGRTAKADIMAAARAAFDMADGESAEAILMKKTRRGKRAGRNQAQRASSFDAARRGSIDADAGLVALVDRRSSFDSRHVSFAPSSPMPAARRMSMDALRPSHSLDIHRPSPYAPQAGVTRVDMTNWWRSSPEINAEPPSPRRLPTSGAGAPSSPFSSGRPVTPTEGQRASRPPPLPTTPERGPAPWIERTPFETGREADFSTSMACDAQYLYPQTIDHLRSAQSAPQRRPGLWGSAHGLGGAQTFSRSSVLGMWGPPGRSAHAFVPPIPPAAGKADAAFCDEGDEGSPPATTTGARRPALSNAPVTEDTSSPPAPRLAQLRITPSDGTGAFLGPSFGPEAECPGGPDVARTSLAPLRLSPREEAARPFDLHAEPGSAQHPASGVAAQGEETGHIRAHGMRPNASELSLLDVVECDGHDALAGHSPESTSRTLFGTESFPGFAVDRAASGELADISTGKTQSPVEAWQARDSNPITCSSVVGFTVGPASADEGKRVSIDAEEGVAIGPPCRSISGGLSHALGSDDLELDEFAFARAPVPLRSARRSMLSASLADLQATGSSEVDGDSLGVDSDSEQCKEGSAGPARAQKVTPAASRRAASHLNLDAMWGNRKSSQDGPLGRIGEGEAGVSVQPGEGGDDKQAEPLASVLSSLPSELLEKLAGPYRDDAGSARMLASLLYSSPCALTVADATQPDEPIVYVNGTFEVKTGYSSAEVLGRNCRFLQSPPGVPRVPCFTTMALRRALDSGKSVSMRLLNYHRSGRAMWNNLCIVPIRNGQGHITHHVGMQTFSDADPLPAVAAPVESERSLNKLGSFGKSRSCTDVAALAVASAGDAGTVIEQAAL